MPPPYGSVGADRPLRPEMSQLERGEAGMAARLAAIALPAASSSSATISSMLRSRSVRLEAVAGVTRRLLA
jgi:hypothetical protein